LVSKLWAEIANPRPGSTLAGDLYQFLAAYMPGKDLAKLLLFWGDCTEGGGGERGGHNLNISCKAGWGKRLTAVSFCPCWPFYYIVYPLLSVHTRTFRYLLNKDGIGF
jgi:hypothetical protein